MDIEKLYQEYFSVVYKYILSICILSKNHTKKFLLLEHMENCLFLRLPNYLKKQQVGQG